MIANFSELHHHVHQRISLGLVVVAVVDLFVAVDEIHDVDLGSQHSIQLFLSVCEIAEHVHLNLIAKLALDILLDTTKHERFKNHMESTKLLFV
ncbi:hypothetical protein OGAPHI_003861 [Ogataea philodendri]|uniref:Uncharacterized protein n=1 Tax=Ogataea philodendri TaxID=1378263 RepID=A0A9P8T484_9ASCO|nr:uncharacterized protein OGAPHI_003861 [Ogataea philodendri]KAH3665673.1 hypothetical protein OGAPHI_003861 [Ogataea philodendri]